MKSLRAFAVIMLLGCGLSLSAALAEQQTSTSDDAMRISVTVAPTCTIGVTPAERTSADAVAVACRNFRAGQPQPLVLDTAPRDGRDVVLIRF